MVVPATPMVGAPALRRPGSRGAPWHRSSSHLQPLRPVNEATATSSPSPTPVKSTVPATIATPAKAPLIGKAEVQAAVAVATGSPLVVQVLTVAFLMGLGVAYFRFLGSRKFNGTPRTGKS